MNQRDPSVAITARGLRKQFGDVVALDGLDLTVPTGSVLGLLGPNGAGKTTAVSILTTLLPADGGEATIAGADLATQPQLVRTRIGLSGQYAAVDETLTGRENLVMVARLYRMSKAAARSRAAALLDRFDLSDAADRPVKGYSGGMRRRLDLAGALVAEPPVLFLDEPTTGLDPRSRIELWSVIRELVSGGATLLLTTQYLEEADQLADDIVVIDKGHAIAQGTSDELKSQFGAARVELVVADASMLDDAAAVLRRHLDRHPDDSVVAAEPPGAGSNAANGPHDAGSDAAGDPQDVEVRPATRTLLAPIAGGVDALGTIISELGAAGVAISDVGLRRPTLDDVFLTLTGHGADESQPESRS